jgi:hypothetical protein
MGIFEADGVRYVCVPVFINSIWNRQLFFGGKIIVSQQLFFQDTEWFIHIRIGWGIYLFFPHQFHSVMSSSSYSDLNILLPVLLLSHNDVWFLECSNNVVQEFYPPFVLIWLLGQNFWLTFCNNFVHLSVLFYFHLFLFSVCISASVSYDVPHNVYITPLCWSNISLVGNIFFVFSQYKVTWLVALFHVMWLHHARPQHRFVPQAASSYTCNLTLD